MSQHLAHPSIDQELEIRGELKGAYGEILTEDAQAFLTQLHRQFNQPRLDLLKKRADRQRLIDQGQLPNFLPETEHIRSGSWQVAPLPKDLLDRRVEITGPVERKMVINALNSGAKTFMADFEDSNTPTWDNLIEGQINLRDAVKGDISYYNQAKDKHYALGEQTAVLMVRPRGWHLNEKHLLVDGEPMSGSLMDFGLYFFHNAKNLLAKGSGPYFYLPKMESHLEARLWNQVFLFAQQYLGLPKGTIKATVLIETITASFELHEILFELRDHSAGLNCGRWDYIFSYIKKLKKQPGMIMPDRAQITMTTPFMKAYSHAVIQACHSRGVHAMGGMAAQIPISHDPEANERALEKVRLDKLREARDGHDGTWVAHPALVKVAEEAFDQHMPTKNQIHITRHEADTSQKDLLEMPKGTITESGVRLNINVGILYIESWLRGQGAAALYHLMEDAATAEISRTQLWQWVHTQTCTEDGQPITADLYHQLKREELTKIKNMLGVDTFDQGRFDEAVQLFDQLVLTDELADFLTIPAYNLID